MNNIFYFKRINKIGGTEQFLYEIAKKYKDLDITIYFDEADSYQLKRLKRFVRCKKRIIGEKVKCKKAFFNFNIDMINDVEAEEYYFISHANYEELGYKPPIDNPKLTKFIGVSQFSTDKLNEWAEKLEIKTRTEKCYNPLTLEPKEDVKILVSACRLDDGVKGGKRTLKLIEALDKYCNKTGKHYIWLIFTNPTRIEVKSPNVVQMKPRVDVRPYIGMADYVLQLSNDMETYCYTINEALGYKVPIVTTPLSICKELPIDDNMRIELNWDCSNLDEVARQIFEKEVKPFDYKIPDDGWLNILVKGKSTYEEGKNMKAKIRCINDYFDLEINKMITRSPEDENYERIVSRERAEHLEQLGLIEIVEIIQERKKPQRAIKPTKKIEKR